MYSVFVLLLLHIPRAEPPFYLIIEVEKLRLYINAFSRSSTKLTICGTVMYRIILINSIHNHYPDKTILSLRKNFLDG